MKHSISLILGLIFLSLGCQQDMVIDLPDAVPKVAVNSIFKTDSVFQVNLSKSRGPLEDTYEITFLNTAVVEIYEGNLRVDSLTNSEAGNYFGTKMPVPGSTYSLRAFYPGLPEVTAIETLPQRANFSNVSIKDSATYSQYEGYQAEITFTVNDPGGIENYYGVVLRLIDTIVYDPNEDTIFSDYQQYYNSLDPLLSQGGFLDDKTFDGTNRQFKIQVPQYIFDYKGSLFLNIVSVSKKGYDYQKSFSRHQDTQGNPFAEPVQVYSNILDGFGIFMGIVTNERKIR